MSTMHRISATLPNGAFRSLRVRVALVAWLLRVGAWLLARVGGDLIQANVQATLSINEEGVRRLINKRIRINGRRP